MSMRSSGTNAEMTDTISEPSSARDRDPQEQADGEST